MSATNIGPQIGLKGVQSYQMDLKTATAATKAFKAELQATSKIKNPFAEVAQKTTALQKEIGAQAEVIRNLSEEYQNAVAKYGEHSKQAYQAQEKLTKANTALKAMVAEYQKLSGAKIEIQGVGTFKNDIETLTQATKTFKAEFNAFGSSFKIGDAFKKAAGQSDALKKSIETQKATITLLKDEYDKAVEEQGEFSKGAMELKEKVANATTELNNMEKTLRDLPNGLENAGNAIQELGSKWTTVGNGFKDAGKVFLPFTAAYSAGMGAAIKVSANFEYQMSKVQAVTANTDEEMAELSNTLLNMSKGSIYAPQQLAEGFEKVARAGITDVNDQLAVLESGLNLATAEGASFDQTADGIISTLYQFNMKMTDAGEVADVVAQASRSAKTDASLLFETFKQAAPSMNAMNFTLRDTALAADLMADSALVGSQAGTYLKTSMANLTAPTDKQREAMEEFNITLERGGKSVSFVDLLGQLRTSFGGLDVDLQDANGELKDADELFEELSGKLPTEQLEKLQGVVTIFGKRSLPAMLAMINATDERFEELKGNLADTTGVASEMAKIVGDSTMGGWQKLTAGLQVLGIELGTALLPVINSFLEKATEWVTKFSEMSDGTKKFIIIGGGILALIGPLLTGIGGMAGGIGTLMNAGGSLMKGIGGLTKLLSGGGGLIGGFKGLVGVLRTALTTMGPVGIAITGIAALATVLMLNWDKVGPYFSQLWEGLKYGFTTGVKSLKELFGGLGKKIGEITDGIKKHVSDRLSAIKNAFVSNGGGIKGTVAAAWTFIKGNFRDGLSIIDRITGLKLTEIYDLFTKKFAELKTKAFSWGKDIVQNIANGLKASLSKVAEGAKAVANKIREFLHFSLPDRGPLADADTYMPDFVDLLSSGLQKGVGQIASATDKLANAMVVQPTAHYADLPAAGATTNNNMGGVSFVINAAPGQDVEELAEIVEERISSLITRREAAYA